MLDRKVLTHIPFVFVLVASCADSSPTDDKKETTEAREQPTASPPGQARTAASPVDKQVADSRATLKTLTDALCACNDNACAKEPYRQFAIWEKELSLMEAEEYRDYVAAINADPEATALRKRASDCAARIYGAAPVNQGVSAPPSSP